MKYVALLMALVVLLGCSPRHSLAIPPLQCNPAVIDELPLNMRAMCARLAGLYELTGNVENYLNEKVYQASPIQPLTERFEGGAKRQDVDHVFLRFGRRR